MCRNCLDFPDDMDWGVKVRPRAAKDAPKASLLEKLYNKALGDMWADCSTQLLYGDAWKTTTNVDPEKVVKKRGSSFQELNNLYRNMLIDKERLALRPMYYFGQDGGQLHTTTDGTNTLSIKPGQMIPLTNIDLYNQPVQHYDEELWRFQMDGFDITARRNYNQYCVVFDIRSYSNGNSFDDYHIDVPGDHFPKGFRFFEKDLRRLLSDCTAYVYYREKIKMRQYHNLGNGRIGYYESREGRPIPREVTDSLKSLAPRPVDFEYKTVNTGDPYSQTLVPFRKQKKPSSLERRVFFRGWRERRRLDTKTVVH